MGAHEYALGPIVWILTTAFRAVGGKVATVLFGNAAALLSDGTEPMAKVPAIRVGGGTAFAGDAIAIGAGHLEMENRRRPRAVCILSDGGWYDTEAGVHEDPLARRARRPHDPPLDRRRAAVGRGQPRLRPHRPRRRPGPDRPAHRRRPHRRPSTAAGRRSRRRHSRPSNPSARTRRPRQPTKESALTHDALLPSPALFDVTAAAGQRAAGTLERVPLEQLELAPNTRRDIARDVDPPPRRDARAHRPARALHRLPARPRPAASRAVRRPAPAARRPRQPRARRHPGVRGPRPVTSLIVLLLDHEPGEDEIRRIQAQENAREPLSLRDQQEQFRDCWQARAGLPDADRMAVVCADLGISTGKGHSLRRQLALPDAIRERIAERPAGDQLSVRMAHRLADMHDIAPELTQAVAARVTTSELHDQALRDLGGFVHRTVVEDEHVYAVRIDDGVLLDGAEQVEHARNHLTAERHAEAAAALGCEPDKLDTELDALAARAKQQRAQAARRRDAARPRRQRPLRLGVRARPGLRRRHLGDRPGVHARRRPPAARRRRRRAPPARRPTSAARASTTTSCATPPKRTASGAPPNAPATPRRPPATSRLGHDIRAALADPSDDQLSALREIVCRLLCEHHPELIAYGAGWTDAERQQPVGDTGRREPRHVDAIVDAELGARSRTPTRCTASPSCSRAGAPRSSSTPTA